MVLHRSMRKPPCATAACFGVRPYRFDDKDHQEIDFYTYIGATRRWLATEKQAKSIGTRGKIGYKS
eukprot:127814-Prorocentrum_minimum.AAC.1